MPITIIMIVIPMYVYVYVFHCSFHNISENLTPVSLTAYLEDNVRIDPHRLFQQGPRKFLLHKHWQGRSRAESLET